MSEFLSTRFNFKRFLFLLLIGLGSFAVFFHLKYRMTGEFEPPTERERLAALGDTGKLPENIGSPKNVVENKIRYIVQLKASNQKSHYVYRTTHFFTPFIGLRNFIGDNII